MSPGVLAFALAFPGGAVLASLADTLIPEAFEHGRPLNAFSTTLGNLLAFCFPTSDNPCQAHLSAVIQAAGLPGGGWPDGVGSREIAGQVW